jgi:hypothetical protein
MPRRSTTRPLLNALQLAAAIICIPLAYALGPVGRDGNSGTGTCYSPGTRPDGYGYEGDFLPTGVTCTRSESRQVRDKYFFPPTGNSMGTWYFTTTIILSCEQVKMRSFYYIFLREVHFVILTMTCSDGWTLLIGYLKYLLNINFEHVYIVFYSLN